MTLRPQIELLSPAGDSECVIAAIENGADAVYFGIEVGFNARARATNISLSNLGSVMQILHVRQVRGYVTLNTLVFSDELERFEKIVRQVAAAGVDAVLVQDLGAARLIRSVCPELPIHASTQMTMTSAETIAEIQSLGIERVVLARELSIQEIKKISSQTDMPLEVFAHGALCVAYSGQCMTSESLGGRSANRGQCAQACRLPYDLVCDGEDVDLGDQKYLLSPQDLAAFDLIPDLIEAGVCSLKIEGRLKTPEYVANITRRYREAIDAALHSRPLPFDHEATDEMELSFSRGFSPGWLGGCDHKMLVPATSSSKRGLRLGVVERIGKNHVTVRLQRDVKLGDGIVFDGDRSKGEEQGGRVYEVRSRRSNTKEKIVDLAFGHGVIDFLRLEIGQAIWKTDDPALTKRLQSTFSSKHPIRKVPLRVNVLARVGNALEVTAFSAKAKVHVTSEKVLEPAHKHAASAELFAKQLDRLGNTSYAIESLECEIVGAPMVPLSVIGDLRHRLVEELDAALTHLPEREIQTTSVLESLRPKHVEKHESQVGLRVLCRTMSQLEAVLELSRQENELHDDQLKDVAVDFQDIREYSAAIELARKSSVNLNIATPRIQKPGEIGIFRKMAEYEPDGVLVRNLAGVRYFQDRQVPIVGDASLNVANELTARTLYEMGIEQMTASYDLNRDQLLELLKSAPADWFEVVIHQHMPMFHMEHCVFCAVLSPGTNKTNCGRPCDFHAVKLRDRVGMEHPLLADVGCRNTLFNAKPQSGAEIVPELIRSGVRKFRIELLDESNASDIHRIVRLYQALISGKKSGREVWSTLQATNRVGLTRGTMEEKRDPLAII